ncbi:MAG TPA: histidine kinase [Candidatus Angelobacter sp.]|jgi:two-component system NarL family sensor kinase|nr:histidine kinase [Candidatus Angelobacter sp.]
MFERLALRRALQRPRRFRTRMLLGMLVVALVPLVVFTAVVAADLGSVSGSTVHDTQQTIIQDQEQRQQGQVADRALAIDVRLGSIASEIRQLRDQTTQALNPLPGDRPPGKVLNFQTDQGAYYSSTADTSVIVGQTSPLVHAGVLDQAQHAAPIAAPSATLIPFMAGMRKSYPEIEAVWIVDKGDSVIRTVPGIDVHAAIRDKRINPDAPLGSDGDLIFSTSQERFAGTAGSPQSWSDPAKPGAQPTGPYWTDPYRTRQGDEGVTVWMPVGTDGSTLVGADITIAQITGALLQPVISGEPGAYPILLSSNNKVLAAGDQAQSDFGLPAHMTGAQLPVDPHATFGSGLLAVEQSGHPENLRGSFAGADREVFTAPIYAAHWVLATSVPMKVLEPDVTGLTRGIENGIHSILLHVIPIALVLCALAFVLATLVARRLVGPVRALQTSAERLASGNTDAPVPPQGSDEVGVLADSLERMRREINASRDTILAAARELEGRVAERTHELRTRNEELVALNTLAGALTRSLDAESILAGALDTARAVLPAMAGRGWVAAAAGPKPGALRSLAQWCADEEGAAVDPDALLGAAQQALDEHGVVVLPGRPRTQPVLVGLPFQAGEETLGALAIACRPGTHLAERTRTLLSAVSDQVGLALRAEQLAAEGRELAVLEERTRLAREIHDTLAQQLTAIVLQLEAAEAYAERSPGRAQSLVITARDLARSALHEARRSVWNLRPAPLEATGLVAALDREVRRWARTSGMPARLSADTLPNPLNLQPAAEVGLLRIAQEALSNAGRHSGATSVEVSLCRRDGALELGVQDDGCGFDPETSPQLGSFGLVGMSERARLAGGSLEIVTSPGQGTRVTVRLPLAEATGAPAVTAVPA